MKKIIIGAGLLVITIIIYSLVGLEDDLELYKANLLLERRQKDNFMSNDRDSPFNIFGDTAITLRYFPIDEKFKLKANIERITSKQYITLGSSDNQSVKYLKYAYAHFRIDNQPLKLLILKNFKDINGSLFTAFADKTSGEETYGAGRYIDLEFKNAQRITIDFNRAYNPYCNYNNNYSCPFPPAENVLPIRIEAGEKDYKH